MIQSWILLRDHAPNTSHKNGLNKSVCGNCPHAGYNQNSCYVKWFQAPLQVWKSYKNNRYDYFKKSDLELIKGRSLRLGSAGDPTVIRFISLGTIIKSMQESYWLHSSMEVRISPSNIRE